LTVIRHVALNLIRPKTSKVGIKIRRQRPDEAMIVYLESSRGGNLSAIALTLLVLHINDPYVM